MDADVCESTVIVVATEDPEPFGMVHSALLWVTVPVKTVQTLDPMAIDTAASVAPKLVPRSVRVPPPVVSELDADMLVMVGAA